MWTMNHQLMLLLLACSAVKASDIANMEEVEELLKMESSIDLKRAERLILLLGSSGVGKSTLAKFVTSDPSLEVRMPDKNSRNVVFVDNGTVSTNVRKSKTVAPNVYQDPESGELVVDCPGFSDTREPKFEIANAFFVKKVLEHPKHVKLVIVENHFSLVAGSDRYGLTRLLKALAELVPHVERFKGSMALVVTKATRWGEDEQLKQDLLDFLADFKEDLKADSNARANATVQGMIRVLDVLVGPSPEDNVAFFWKPVASRRYSVQDLLTDSKTKIRSLVFDKMAWADNTGVVYRYALTKESKLFIQHTLAPTNYDATAEELTKFFARLKTRTISKIHNFTKKSEGIDFMKTLKSELSLANKTRLTKMMDVLNVTQRLSNIAPGEEVNATVVQYHASKVDFFKEFGVDLVKRLKSVLKTEVLDLEQWLTDTIQNAEKLVQLEERIVQEKMKAEELFNRTEANAKEAMDRAEKELADARSQLDLNNKETVDRLAAAEEFRKITEQNNLRAAEESKAVLELLQQSMKDNKEMAEKFYSLYANSIKEPPASTSSKGFWEGIGEAIVSIFG